jgi:small GTP-binding protein
VTLQVWDTAGQELYKALVPVYLRAARAALIVYDVTEKESFASLSKWHEILDDSVPSGVATFIVANKIDLEDDIVVDEAEAKQFAAAHAAKLFHVSAVTGAGLEALFEAVAKAIEEGAQVEMLPSGPVANDAPNGCDC